MAVKSPKPSTHKAQQQRLEAAFGFAKPENQVYLLSPEGVPVEANRVPPMTRLGAVAIDVAIQIGLIFLVLLAFAYWAGLNGFFSPVVSIFWSFFLLAMRLPYFLFQEYYFRGQTIGKKVVGIRVVDEAGGRLRFSSLVVRTITREVEVLYPTMFFFTLWFNLQTLNFEYGWETWVMIAWLLFVGVFPFLNKDRKRLGDMLAGTVVVAVPKPKLGKDLGAAKVGQNFSFTLQQLAAYGEFEVQVLQRVLQQGENQTAGQQDLRAIVDAIAKKVRYTSRIPKGTERDFLTAFYLAQRKYLEEGMLVGKRKASKLDSEKTL